MISQEHIRLPILLAFAAMGSLCMSQLSFAQQDPHELIDAFPLDIQFSNSSNYSNAPFLHYSSTPELPYSNSPLLHSSDTPSSLHSISPLLQFSTVSALASPPQRSPLIAGLLSAALPGLGQAYAEDWALSWKSVAFVTAEVGLWVAVASYNSRGDSQTDEFQRFADVHWDVTRYATWIESNIGQLNPGVNTAGMVTSSDPALAPWDRVSWIRINEVEDAIGQKTGTGFTHRLPHRPEQQYYELIGKYAQFGGGWDDAPSFTPADIVTDNVSPRFLAYSKMRGRANDLYSNATTASYFIVANHVISALEAAWSTSRANRRLEARAEMRRIDRGLFSEEVPHLVVKAEF